MSNVTWAMFEQLQGNLTALQRDHSQMLEEITYLEGYTGEIQKDVDTFYVLMGAILVTAMQPGFALLEVGGNSAKHTKNILIKNLLDMACSFLAWWAFGHGFAYSPHGNQFIGGGGFMVKGDLYQNMDASYGSDEGFNFAFFFFQMAFCGTAATIVSGAAGERITLTAYFFLSFILAGFIYPVLVRWGWSSQGWASAFSEDPFLGCGIIDFSGCGVIHSCGGAVSLTLIATIGPRVNRWGEDGKPNNMPKQSAVFVTLGTFILLVTWFGFNGMSTLAAVGSAHVAAKVMTTTAMSAASAMGTAAVLGFLMEGATSPDQVCNGMLAGLVAITAGCSVVEVEAAVIIGAVAAYVYIRASQLMLAYRLDDSVDAVAVHLCNGAWGMIAAGLFATSENYAEAYYSDRAEKCCGFFYGCGLRQLGTNIIFECVSIVWSAASSYIFLRGLAYLQILRVSRKAEIQGLDSDTHGGEEVSEQMKELLGMMNAQQSARSAMTDCKDMSNSARGPGGGGGTAGTFTNNSTHSKSGREGPVMVNPAARLQKVNSMSRMG